MTTATLLQRTTGQLLMTATDLAYDYEQIPEPDRAAVRPDTGQRHEIHILSATVLWPDPLTDDQVEAHVMTDLLADSDYSHEVDWVWVIDPEIREVSEAERLRAVGQREVDA